jgi:uncharacterized membrane protein
MATIGARVPAYLLSSVILLGAVSRFTHGAYTPRFYAWQEYHAPDDGSAVAKFTPIIDTMLGLTILLGTRSLRLAASSVSLGFIVIGLVIQLTAEKDYTWDIALVLLATFAVVGLMDSPQEKMMQDRMLQGKTE